MKSSTHYLQRIFFTDEFVHWCVGTSDSCLIGGNEPGCGKAIWVAAGPMKNLRRDGLRSWGRGRKCG